ncbi:MAG: hypothetical protein Q7U54_10925 [Bacteroidales bacterium]|nr:hypothetical protein [Bacteroidales bacterium]
MNELDLKNAWQSYDRKLDRLLEVNFQQLKDIQSIKAESKINSFKKSHIFVMLLGVAWVWLLGFLVYHTKDNPYFTISVGVIMLFNVFAVVLYFRHIIILSSINIAESIIETQRKLTLVYTSYVQVGRVLLLQTPLYCTWWYTEELVQHGGFIFWTIQAVIVTSFTAIAIYLFRKLSLKSKSGNWVKRTDKFFGAEKLQKAIAFLDEIEEFKKEKDSA